MVDTRERGELFSRGGEEKLERVTPVIMPKSGTGNLTLVLHSIFSHPHTHFYSETTKRNNKWIP
jgi:hypothetical protein